MSGDWDERIHDAEDLYSRAAFTWGHDAQWTKAAEEFAECSAAISREVNGQADRDELLEELVDARIMLEQIAWHITDDALDDVAEEKLAELDERVVGGGSR